MMFVNKDECIGCGLCIKDCFPRDIELVEGKAVIKNESCIKCGHCIAICPKNAVATDEYDMSDIKEYNKESFDLNADNLMNAIQFRRSTRHFKDQEIEKDKLLKILEAGRFTQTARNFQDVSYTVVTEGLQELKELTYEALRKMGEHMLANLTPETQVYKKYAELWVNMGKWYKADPKTNDKLFFNAPAIIVVTAGSDVDGALASSNMELMTGALGLGTFFSGFFTRAAQSSEEIQKFIGLEKGKKIVTCMVLGYPVLKYRRTVPRKDAQISWK